jgi:glycosyltransferase involved in cell wall biosynthesis
MQIDVWHTILWSRYKAAVFSELARIAPRSNLKLRFIHIAATDEQRKNLTRVDTTAHKYQYELLYNGGWEDAPPLYICAKAVGDVLLTKSDVVALAGYSKVVYWAQLLAAKLRGLRVLGFCDATVNDKPRGGINELLKRFIFNRFEIIFCYGQRSAEYIERYGVPKTRIVLRCQATEPLVALTAAEILQQREYLRSHDRFESAGTPINLLYVGRLSPEKDIETLLRAVSLLLEGGRSVSLRIVGSGPLDAQLRHVASTLGVSACVEFVGPLEPMRLSTEYMKADMLILPSKSEPWGLVANEALQLGCPIVVSDVCGCVPELAANLDTGRSFPVGDELGLSEEIIALKALVDSDGGLALRCQRAIAPYTPLAAAEQLLSGFERIACR